MTKNVGYLVIEMGLEIVILDKISQKLCSFAVKYGNVIVSLCVFGALDLNI